MKTCFVIVKKYNGKLETDKRYWRDELTGFINGIGGACLFHSYDHAEEILKDKIKEEGVFQIEKIYIN